MNSTTHPIEASQKTPELWLPKEHIFSCGGAVALQHLLKINEPTYPECIATVESDCPGAKDLWYPETKRIYKLKDVAKAKEFLTRYVIPSRKYVEDFWNGLGVPKIDPMAVKAALPPLSYWVKPRREEFGAGGVSGSVSFGMHIKSKGEATVAMAKTIVNLSAEVNADDIVAQPRELLTSLSEVHYPCFMHMYTGTYLLDDLVFSGQADEGFIDGDGMVLRKDKAFHHFASDPWKPLALRKHCDRTANAGESSTFLSRRLERAVNAMLVCNEVAWESSQTLILQYSQEVQDASLRSVKNRWFLAFGEELKENLRLGLFVLQTKLVKKLNEDAGLRKLYSRSGYHTFLLRIAVGLAAKDQEVIRYCSELEMMVGTPRLSSVLDCATLFGSLATSYRDYLAQNSLDGTFTCSDMIYFSGSVAGPSNNMRCSLLYQYVKDILIREGVEPGEVTSIACSYNTWVTADFITQYRHFRSYDEVGSFVMELQRYPKSFFYFYDDLCDPQWFLRMCLLLISTPIYAAAFRIHWYSLSRTEVNVLLIWACQTWDFRLGYGYLSQTGLGVLALRRTSVLELEDALAEAIALSHALHDLHFRTVVALLRWRVNANFLPVDYDSSWEDHQLIRHEMQRAYSGSVVTVSLPSQEQFHNTELNIWGRIRVLGPRVEPG